MFLVGFVAGIIATLFVLYLISLGLRSNRSNYAEKEVQVQYVEIKGKKGNVTLHTGMPKDSVRMLVGKPDEVHLNRIASTNYEKWGYKLKNKYISDLDINFRDGKLDGVRQN